MKKYNVSNKLVMTIVNFIIRSIAILSFLGFCTIVSSSGMEISQHSKTQVLIEKQKQLRRLLKSLPMICQKQKTFKEKVKYMNQIIKKINSLSLVLLKKYGDTDLALDMVNVTEDSINNFITADGLSITPKIITELDLRRGFTISYAQYDRTVRYDAKIGDFPDKWARQIYQGLDCLYQACGKDCSNI